MCLDINLSIMVIYVGYLCASYMIYTFGHMAYYLCPIKQENLAGIIFGKMDESRFWQKIGEWIHWPKSY